MYFAMMRFTNKTTESEAPVIEAPISCFRQLLEQWAICEYYKYENVETRGKPVEVYGEALTFLKGNRCYMGTASYDGTSSNVIIHQPELK